MEMFRLGVHFCVCVCNLMFHLSLIIMRTLTPRSLINSQSSGCNPIFCFLFFFFHLSTPPPLLLHFISPISFQWGSIPWRVYLFPCKVNKCTKVTQKNWRGIEEFWKWKQTDTDTEKEVQVIKCIISTYSNRQSKSTPTVCTHVPQSP